MAGLDPAMHVFGGRCMAWVRGTEAMNDARYLLKAVPF
jgi:hypothetical protein